jgi:organic hydroperoxide reductase OsmC/OhrA
VPEASIRGCHVLTVTSLITKKKILELVKKVENKILKKKTKKKQIVKAITSEIKKEKDEYIEKNTSKSESNCIIVASSRSKSRRED